MTVSAAVNALCESMWQAGVALLTSSGRRTHCRLGTRTQYVERGPHRPVDVVVILDNTRTYDHLIYSKNTDLHLNLVLFTSC